MPLAPVTTPCRSVPIPQGAACGLEGMNDSRLQPRIRPGQDRKRTYPISERMSSTNSGVIFWPIFEPDDETQTGPGVVDGAYLVVHQARVQTDDADRVFGQIGGDAGRLL